MALDMVVKVEITAHTAVMDRMLEELQRLSIVQIDAHSVKDYESEKAEIQRTSQKILDMKKELTELEKAIRFLDVHGPKVSFLQKLSMAPEELSKSSMKGLVVKGAAESLKANTLELERELNEREAHHKEHVQQRGELLPFSEFQPALDELKGSGAVKILFSKLERESFENLSRVDISELVHIEKISGDETVFFYIVYHQDAQESVLELEKSFNFEPISLPEASKSPSELINEHTEKIKEAESDITRLKDSASELAQKRNILRYYFDLLQIEIEKESAKEKFFYTKRVCLINGWMRERDYPLLSQTVGRYPEAYASVIEREDDETPPVAYKNNRIVSPFELIVNLYSPPNHREVDPTPILMPFYALFFGICLTEAGYGLVIMIICLLGLLILKPRNGMRRFLNLFLILGIFTFVVGALMGTVFGINFDMLPEKLAWLREARYKIMIFDSSKDVLTFFALSLALGVIHLIVGYLIKIYMLVKSGDWVEAVCDHLPWVFLLLAPVPKVLMRALPEQESLLNTVFYVLLALWAGIIVLFSERNSLNPIKRIGKGLFTLYGVSGVLGDVLSYSRLLALGLATGVIAGVMNTLASMVKQLPIVGIGGFVLVLLVGHLFNLFISGLSAFVHSIRLQFMEFFTKFYTGEGELLTVFSERRSYTYAPRRSNPSGR
jgi:V/A-type H+-transporting ATPase subunit I